MNANFRSEPKIKIEGELARFLDDFLPGDYEPHFLDITYDLKTPTVFGFCFGESDFGKYVVVGTASRSTYSEAIKKVIKEMGQGVSYLRFQLEQLKDWIFSKTFTPPVCLGQKR